MKNTNTNTERDLYEEALDTALDNYKEYGRAEWSAGAVEEKIKGKIPYNAVVRLADTLAEAEAENDRIGEKTTVFCKINNTKGLLNRGEDFETWWEDGDSYNWGNCVVKVFERWEVTGPSNRFDWEIDRNGPYAGEVDENGEFTGDWCFSWDEESKGENWENFALGDPKFPDDYERKREAAAILEKMIAEIIAEIAVADDEDEEE